LKSFFEKMMNKLGGFIGFLKDTRKELNNVSWPGRSEVTGTTLVVIVTVFFFGFFLYIVDVLVGSGMDFILRAMSAHP
jgi:preprotein translocase subunit SecE